MCTKFGGPSLNTFSVILPKVTYTFIHYSCMYVYRQTDRHKTHGAYHCNLALLHGCGLNMGLMSPSTDYRIGQSPVTLVIAKRWLRLFGHLARANPSQDHSCILRAAINRPPADWQHRAGRPRQTWLCTIEIDLRPYNLGLNTAWMRVQDRSKWRQLEEMATLTDRRATRWWWWSTDYSSSQRQGETVVGMEE